MGLNVTCRFAPAVPEICVALSQSEATVAGVDVLVTLLGHNRVADREAGRLHGVDVVPEHIGRLLERGSRGRSEPDSHADADG